MQLNLKFSNILKDVTFKSWKLRLRQNPQNWRTFTGRCLFDFIFATKFCSLKQLVIWNNAKPMFIETVGCCHHLSVLSTECNRVFSYDFLEFFQTFNIENYQLLGSLDLSCELSHHTSRCFCSNERIRSIWKSIRKYGFSSS